jgi:hypothetical protein
MTGVNGAFPRILKGQLKGQLILKHQKTGRTTEKVARTHLQWRHARDMENFRLCGIYLQHPEACWLNRKHEDSKFVLARMTRRISHIAKAIA